MNFKHDIEIYNTRSAKEVVPIIMNLLNPQSVVDIGCGIGTWLAVFKSFGVKDILGIDGDYVSKNLLHQNLKECEFLSHDLTQTLNFNRKFDLVISLEVAEHIPETSADTFIRTLISMGDFILFSAAIPYQDGDGHINNQWPVYWQHKFKEHGFTMYDHFRLKMWLNETIDWWYRQNMFLVIRNEIDLGIPISTTLPNLICPELYELKVKKIFELQKEIEVLQKRNHSIKFATKRLFQTISDKMFKF